jgi:anthranilate synthase component 2
VTSDRGRAPAKVLVIDHYDSYTYNLVHLIASVTGELPDVVQHDAPESDRSWRVGYSHIVLSPGPGTVRAPADFSLGRAVITSSTRPVLGVCLGMQGIVQVLGGRVDTIAPAHGEVTEVFHSGTGLFAGLDQGFSAVRYHSQAALEVPSSLRVTAWCSGTGADVVMGVEHVSRPLHGVQFHPESILTQGGHVMVRNFLALS